MRITKKVNFSLIFYIQSVNLLVLFYQKLFGNYFYSKEQHKKLEEGLTDVLHPYVKLLFKRWLPRVFCIAVTLSNSPNLVCNNFRGPQTAHISQGAMSALLQIVTWGVLLSGDRGWAAHLPYEDFLLLNLPGESENSRPSRKSGPSPLLRKESNSYPHYSCFPIPTT